MFLVFITLFGNNFSLLVRLLVFCFLSASQFLSCLITEWGPQAFQNRIVLTWRRKRTKLATMEIGTSSLIWSLFRSYHLNFKIVLICSKRTLSSSSWEKRHRICVHGACKWKLFIPWILHHPYVNLSIPYTNSTKQRHSTFWV